MGNTSATIAALQAQLSSTQSILVSHKDRIRSLETLLSEQEAIKDEVLGIRHQLEESKREYEGLLKESREYAGGQAQHHEAEEKVNESPVPLRHSWQKSAAPAAAADTDTGVEYEGDITDGIMDDFEDARSTSSDSKAIKATGNPSSDPSASLRQEELMAQNTALSLRLDALSSELEQALELSRSLQSQHAEATSTVKVLEERVQSLEKDMARRVTEVSTAGKAAEDKWEAWKNRFEEGWRKEKEGWELERERLRGVVREWEEASRRAQEEEEERLMNSRMGGEDTIVDSDEGDSDEETSDRSRTSKRVSGTRSWPEMTSGADSGAVESDEDEDVPRSPRKSSHSASPSMSRPDPIRRSRRESSSRLDPAIRALRATAGDLPEQQRKTGRGSRTPRTGSPSAADDALESLRVKANRPKRADTIKGRKRGQTAAPDPVKALSPGKQSSNADKPAAKVDSLKADPSVVTREDEKESDGNNTSTESDETAHGRSRDDINADDDTATISAAPAEVKGVRQIIQVSIFSCAREYPVLIPICSPCQWRSRWFSSRLSDTRI